MKKLYEELLRPVKNRVDNDTREDVAWQSSVVTYLDSISRCLYVMATTLADLDEEESDEYKYVSKCCGALVWVKGAGSTKHYECTECRKVCDLR